jgi:hypothetical protein
MHSSRFYLRRTVTLLSAGLFLSSCGFTPKLPKLPKVSLPKIDVPFVGDESTAPKSDPSVPFSMKQSLGYGHTLKITAFAGQRSPKQIFAGDVMVDEKGVADLGSYGEVKLGGLKATEALAALEGAFRRKRGESLINVHLASVEGVSLITMRGAVRQPGVIQWFDGAYVANALPYVGGRTPSSKGEAIYVMHEGRQRFFASASSAAAVLLEPGDIVTLSEDL